MAKRKTDGKMNGAWVQTSTLRARGWNAEMIRDLLSKPYTPPGSSDLELYRQTEILGIENRRPGFKAILKLNAAAWGMNTWDPR